MVDIHCLELKNKLMSADEAVQLIGPDSTICFSGFTRSGYPKEVPLAMARLGKATGLTVITGASTGPELDGALANAGLIKKRAPFQVCKELKNAINAGEIEFVDTHLGHIPYHLQAGYYDVDWAVIECSAILEDGSVVPTTSAGSNEIMMDVAKNIILELNSYYEEKLTGIHDIIPVGVPGERRELPIYDPGDRVGTTSIKVDLSKVRAVVMGDKPDAPIIFTQPDENSVKIAENIIDLLEKEVALGRLPKNLLPIQSGVGSVANAVLAGMENSSFEDLTMFTEVIQDSALKLIKSGKIKMASCTALSLSKEAQIDFMENIDFYKQHIVMRPQHVSNNAELSRRLGVIALNTAVEFDLTGCVNSTNVLGSSVINGIGGSADFARAANIVVFSTVSVAKGGKISSVVPMCAHVDHVEHDVHVVVTEQGYADLRGKSAKERAELVIENCCHPDYKKALRDYYEHAKEVSYGQNIPLDLENALSWHIRFQKTGSMMEEQNE